MATAYEHISKNKRLSMLFVLLFPISFVLFAYLAIILFFLLVSGLNYLSPTSYLTFGSTLQVFHAKAMHVCSFLLPLCFMTGAFWSYIAVKEGDKILLNRIGGVRILYYFEAEDAHQLLENLCIATGMPMPQLYVLEDSSLNAFAVGASPQTSSIVLSRGLLGKLDRAQLEGVLAQQLAHIRVYDVRMMSMIIMCLAFFTFAGEYLFYGTERANISSWKDVAYQPMVRVPVFMYVGAVLLGYGYLFAPLIRFAVSRNYQFLADAQAALMTRYPKGLAKALWHISEDSRLEALDHTELLGMLCVENPHALNTLFSRVSGLFQSHPPVEERIYALNDMDGLFLRVPTKK